MTPAAPPVDAPPSDAPAADAPGAAARPAASWPGLAPAPPGLDVADLRRETRRRLPRPVFEFMDGGAEDELTLARNRAAFAEVELIPDVLRDVSDVDLTTMLFGRRIAAPLMFAPTGMTRLFHPDGEAAVARTAAAAGLPYALSTMATTGFEAVARAGAGAPLAFQLYLFRDRGVAAEMLRRARETGFETLILTVDTVVPGNRQRDVRNGFRAPPAITPRTFLHYASRPGWSLPAFGRRGMEFAILREVLGERAEVGTLFAFAAREVEPRLTWAELDWAVSLWDGPVAVKGLMTGADAARARDHGASAVVVSNHGGRQLDGAPATLDQLEEVAAAVKGQVEILLDGGVRRGADILRALALGADACAIGRPYLYGLSARGEAGVAAAASVLMAELKRAMTLAGIPSIAEIEPRHARRRRRG